jgi:hypothetical protein
MADNEAVVQEWPNQRLKILVPTWTLMIISTMFLTWRVVYGLMKARRFMLSDYLLLVAGVSTLAHHHDHSGTNRTRLLISLQHASIRSW